MIAENEPKWLTFTSQTQHGLQTMRNVPKLSVLSECPYTSTELTGAEATVYSHCKGSFMTQATIPTERVNECLQGEGRMCSASFHQTVHPTTEGLAEL